MIRRILGGLILASPVIAVSLAPLYLAEAEWSEVGLAWAIVIAVAILVTVGLSLIWNN